MFYNFTRTNNYNLCWYSNTFQSWSYFKVGFLFLMSIIAVVFIIDGLESCINIFLVVMIIYMLRTGFLLVVASSNNINNVFKRAFNSLTTNTNALKASFYPSMLVFEPLFSINEDVEISEALLFQVINLIVTCVKNYGDLGEILSYINANYGVFITYKNVEILLRLLPLVDPSLLSSLDMSSSSLTLRHVSVTGLVAAAATKGFVESYSTELIVVLAITAFIFAVLVVKQEEDLLQKKIAMQSKVEPTVYSSSFEPQYYFEFTDIVPFILISFSFILLIFYFNKNMKNYFDLTLQQLYFLAHKKLFLPTVNANPSPTITPCPKNTFWNCEMFCLCAQIIIKERRDTFNVSFIKEALLGIIKRQDDRDKWLYVEEEFAKAYPFESQAPLTSSKSKRLEEQMQDVELFGYCLSYLKLKK